jgi:hypothetical protein
MSLNQKKHNDKKKQAEIEERRKAVAANLLGGLNYRDMAGALGVSVGTIAEDVKVIIGRWQREQIKDTGEYVELELLRLDRALNAIWPKVQAGDPNNIGLMLKIQERRAKYKGLDAPVKQELSGPEGQPLQFSEVLVKVQRDSEVSGQPIPPEGGERSEPMED